MPDWYDYDYKKECSTNNDNVAHTRSQFNPDVTKLLSPRWAMKAKTFEIQISSSELQNHLSLIW